MTAQEKRVSKKTQATITLVVASLLSVTTLTVLAVKADAQPHHDEFHSNSNAAQRQAAVQKATTVVENPLGKAGALAIMSDPTNPAVQWFEHFDQTVVCYMKTDAEAAILTRPFNQEVERVQHWTDTAGKVAVKYKYLASVLRKIEVPSGYPGLKDYCNLTADWYADSAEVYDELIKPRRAARTMEELDDGLNAIKNKAQGLAEMQKKLKQMDVSLRMQYGVHMREQEDALTKYVKGTKEQIRSVGGNPSR
ncbi:MAG: hypothetical protein K2X93_19790 [Candidatus Obscuribacterales bacterium]|nr:hypothetical protein [Candidatus Obscuribacterales bacterium]